MSYNYSNKNQPRYNNRKYNQPYYDYYTQSQNESI